jgi:hypothetical protein
MEPYESPTNLGGAALAGAGGEATAEKIGLGRMEFRTVSKKPLIPNSYRDVEKRRATYRYTAKELWQRIY